MKQTLKKGMLGLVVVGAITVGFLDPADGLAQGMMGGQHGMGMMGPGMMGGQPQGWTGNQGGMMGPGMMGGQPQEWTGNQGRMIGPGMMGGQRWWNGFRIVPGPGMMGGQ